MRPQPHATTSPGPAHRRPDRRPFAILALSGVLFAGWVSPVSAFAEELDQGIAPWLRDRGPGMATSMFGTYVRHGELLLYPFFESYADRNFEYKPGDFGFGSDVDYRGEYEASEGLVFLAYGVRPNLVVEMEAAVIDAEIERAGDDPTGMPREIGERGLGDVEGQLRWRALTETARRPEVFAYFETVLPLQKTRKLIGTPDWEFKLGAGITRGFRWGTMTVRSAMDYARAEGKVEAGEYGIEYLKRLSRAWRVVAAIEGNQVDEVALITEAQWQLAPRAMLKLNNGWGLTPNATDLAPEVGVLFSF